MRRVVQTKPWRESSATHRSAVCRELNTIGSMVPKRRFEGDGCGEIHRGRATGGHPEIGPPRQPMPPGPLSTEPRGHVADGQGGEIAEPSHPQPA